MLEARIASLEEKLRSATVIDSSELDSDVVRVGVTVHVKNEDDGKGDQFMIVGSTEADPSASPKRLSNESPVGKALLGHKKQRRGRRAPALGQGAQAQDHQDRRPVVR